MDGGCRSLFWRFAVLGGPLFPEFGKGGDFGAVFGIAWVFHNARALDSKLRRFYTPGATNRWLGDSNVENFVGCAVGGCLRYFGFGAGTWGSSRAEIYAAAEWDYATFDCG